MQLTTPFTLINLYTGESSVVPLEESNDYLKKLLGTLIVAGGGHIPGMPRWVILIRHEQEYAEIDIGYGKLLMATSSVLAWQKPHALAAWNHATQMLASYELRPNDPDFEAKLPNMPEFAPWLATYIHPEIERAVCPHHLRWILPFLKLLGTEIIARRMARSAQVTQPIPTTNPLCN